MLRVHQNYGLNHLEKWSRKLYAKQDYVRSLSVISIIREFEHSKNEDHGLLQFIAFLLNNAG